MQGASMARYVPSGHLVFARGGGLFAVSFNADTLTTLGTPQPILQGVSGDETTGAAHFSIAADGTLAYIPGGPGANQRAGFSGVIEVATSRQSISHLLNTMTYTSHRTDREWRSSRGPAAAATSGFMTLSGLLPPV